MTRQGRPASASATTAGRAQKASLRRPWRRRSSDPIASAAPRRRRRRRSSVAAQDGRCGSGRRAIPRRLRSRPWPFGLAAFDGAASLGERCQRRCCGPSLAGRWLSVSPMTSTIPSEHDGAIHHCRSRTGPKAGEINALQQRRRTPRTREPAGDEFRARRDGRSGRRDDPRTRRWRRRLYTSLPTRPTIHRATSRWLTPMATTGRSRRRSRANGVGSECGARTTGERFRARGRRRESSGKRQAAS